MKRVLKFVKGKTSNVNGSSSRSVLSESSISEKDSRISSQRKDEFSITEIKKTLQNASCNGNIDELAKYLSYIDVNCVDNLGRTLLNVAALNGHLSCVEFLLSNYADPSIRDLHGMTPLLNAVERNHVQCVDVILTSKETKNTDIVVAAHLAIEKENYEIISLLINKQLNLSKTNEFGENCLHIAAKLQCLNMVNLLLHHKYPIDEIDINSKTSLMVAASLGNIEIVRLLISFKAKLNLKDMEGMTAADLALKNGYIEVYNELQNANKIEDSDQNNVSEKVTAFEQSASEICENQNDSDEWNDSVTSEVDDKKSKKINLVSLMTIKDSYGTEMEINMDEKNVAGSINTASENSDQTLKEIDELTDNSAPQSLTNFLQLPKNKKDVDILSIASGGKEEISIRSSVSASPQSGVIPPPCKPLRSLEYLQSTEFPGNSDPFMYLKANRLFTLGTVRTRHISFTETAASKEKFNSLQRRSFHDEYSDTEKNENSLEFHDLKVSHKTKGSQCSDDSPNVSNKIDTPTSESDWGSDKSLPIQNINSHSSNSPKSDNSSSSRSKHSSFLKSLKNASIRNLFPLKSNTNSKENVKFSETVDNSIQTISEKISDNIKSETVMTNINSQQLVVKHVSADGINLPLVFELNQNAQVNFKSPDNNSYKINEALQHNDKFMKTQLESYDDALKHLEKCDLNTIYQKSKSLPRTTSPPVNMFQIGSLSLPRTLTADAFSEVKGVYKYSPQSLFPWRKDKVSEYHTLPRKKIKLFDRIKHVFDNKTQKMKSDSHKVIHSLHSNDKSFKDIIDRSSNNINKSVIKNNRMENKEENISESSDKINIQHKSMYFDDSERSKNEDVIVTYKDVCLQSATTNIDIEPNTSNHSNLSSIEATEEIQYLTTLIQDSSEVKPQTVEETPLDESLKWKKQCDYLSQKIDEMYTGLTNTENLIEKKPSNMIHNSKKIEFTQSTHTKENTRASNSKIETIDRSIFEKCEKLQAFVEKQHCYFQEPVKKHEDFESQGNILRNKLTVENINVEIAKDTDMTIKECNCLEIPQLKEVIIAKEEEINMLSDLVKSSKETEKKLIELKETLEIIRNENDEMKKKLQESKSIDDKTEFNNKCICNKCNELNRVEYLALQKVNESYIMDIANLKRDNEIIKNEYEIIQKENVELKERNYEIEKQLEFKNQTIQIVNAKVEEVKNNSHKSILKINQLTDENVSLEMKFEELQNAMILKKNTVLQLETENQLLMKSCTEKCLEIQHVEDKLKMTELKLKSLTECKDSEVSKLSMLCERLKSELNETLCKYKKLQYDLEKKNSEEKERSQLEIEKCKNINESLKSTLSYLKSELDKSKLVLCEIEKQSHVDVENYKKDLEKLRWDNSHLKNDIEILTIEKNNFLSKLNVNIDEVDILQKQLKKVFTENIELRTHIEELNDNFKLMKLENEKNIERIADQEHRLKTYLKELDNANIALDVAQDDLEISKLKELKLKEDIDKMVKVFDSKMSERDIEMYNFSLVSDVDSFYDMGFDEKITFSTKCICHINKLNSFNVVMPAKTSILSKKSWNPKLAIIYETELMLSFKKHETDVNCEGCKKISHIQLNKVKINKNLDSLNISPNNFETDMDCCLKQARFKNEYSLCLGDEINHFQLKANTDLSKNVEYFKKIVESLQKQLSVLYTQISDETIKRNTLEIQLKTLENTLKEKIDHENKVKKSEKEEMLAMKTRLQNEFRESKQCLLSELTTVRIALDEKCEEEKKLRNKCEMLLQDIETKKDEQLEKLLNRADELLSYARESRYLKYVDKGLNTKFSQGMKTKSCTFIKSESCSYDKGSTNSFPKCSFSNVASPVSMKPFICQSAATVSQSYTELYRLQLDDVIRQHRASLDIDTLHPSNKLMEELKQKYCID